MPLRRTREMDWEIDAGLETCLTRHFSNLAAGTSDNDTGIPPRPVVGRRTDQPTLGRGGGLQRRGSGNKGHSPGSGTTWRQSAAPGMARPASYFVSSPSRPALSATVSHGGIDASYEVAGGFRHTAGVTGGRR